MDTKTIKDKVKKCVQMLLENEGAIIDNNINERTLSHKLAEYLQQEFKNTKIPGKEKNYDVDCEYNRNREQGRNEPKILWCLRVDCRQKYDKIKENHHTYDDIRYFFQEVSTFPDIIIHERLTNDNNLLVIEMKKSNNHSDWSLDEKKLEGFTGEECNSYVYTLGLHLIINIPTQEDKKDWFPATLEWYENGKKNKTDQVMVPLSM